MSLGNIQLETYSPAQCAPLNISWAGGQPPLRIQAFLQTTPNVSPWTPVPSLFANINATDPGTDNSTAPAGGGGGGDGNDADAFSHVVVGDWGGQLQMQVVARQGQGLWVEMTDHSGSRAQSMGVAVVGAGSDDCLTSKADSSDGDPYVYATMVLAGASGFLILIVFYIGLTLRRTRRRLLDLQLTGIDLPTSPNQTRRLASHNAPYTDTSLTGDDEALIGAVGGPGGWEKGRRRRTVTGWDDESGDVARAGTSTPPLRPIPRAQRSTASLASDPFTDWRAANTSPPSATGADDYSPLRSAVSTTPSWRRLHGSRADPTPSTTIAPAIPPSDPASSGPAPEMSTLAPPLPPSRGSSSQSHTNASSASAEWKAGDDGARIASSCAGSRRSTVTSSSSTAEDSTTSAANAGSSAGTGGGGGGGRRTPSDSGTYESDEFWRRRRTQH